MSNRSKIYRTVIGPLAAGAALIGAAAFIAAPAQAAPAGSAHASTASGSAAASMPPRPVTASGSPGPSPAGVGPVKSPLPGAAPREAAAAAAAEHVFHALTRLDGYTDGAFGTFRVYKPHLTDNDSHSLAEMDVEAPSGAGSTSDIIEVGWTVDRILNHDDTPRLFVFHWVAGSPIGYNGQGFVPQPGAAEKPGDPLVPGSDHKFMIKHYQGNWWIGDNDAWFGRYPDSLWPHLDPQGNVDGSTFTKGFRVQWFGEVSTAALRPCSQMGNGYFSSDFNGAARIDDIGEFNGPVVALHPLSDAPDYYTATANGALGIHYGGPGACVGPPPVAVPNLIGLSTAAARNTIKLAGLKVGVVSSVPQPNCNDHVISQTPAFGAGGGIDPGSLVNFEYSVAPTANGCPETQ
jgi:hypothetical protein